MPGYEFSYEKAMGDITLKAGILPTEIRNHSKAVSYVPRGLDATLATGSIDYKFKNNYDYPIVINASAKDGKLTIEFWPNKKALKGITYEARGYARGNTAKHIFMDMIKMEIKFMKSI